MKTEEKSASNKKLISLCVIERALEGDIQAINKVFEYYGAAEPPVRCGESHLSGLTEPPHFIY